MAGQEVIPVYEGRDDRSYISGHPSGKFMYILGAQCVFKSKFNTTTKEFQTPIIFAGRFNEWGYVDGQGEQARFDTPVQGTFVKNEDYVRYVLSNEKIWGEDMTKYLNIVEVVTEKKQSMEKEYEPVC